MAGGNRRHRRWNITPVREYAHFRVVLDRDGDLLTPATWMLRTLAASKPTRMGTTVPFRGHCVLVWSQLTQRRAA